MKAPVIAVLATGLLLSGCNQKLAQAEKPVALESEMQQVSYGLGANLAVRLSSQELDLDVPAFTAGIRDALERNPMKMTEDQMKEVLETFQKKEVERRQQQAQDVAQNNLDAATAFLEANAAKEGVMTAASGLQYKIVTAGTGAKPTAEDTVEVHYKGTLIDGREFDSSYARNAPVTFPVNGVIPGWTEALQMMPVGSKWELYIPPELAYGAGGAGNGAIAPNSALVFEVELLAIKDADES